MYSELIKVSSCCDIALKEPKWTFDVTQNNSYVQLSALLCVFLRLLRDLRQTYTERFVKPAVVRDFWSVKWSLPLTLPYQDLTGSCKES